jgi:hypothetical protein
MTNAATAAKGKENVNVNVTVIITTEPSLPPHSYSFFRSF